MAKKPKSKAKKLAPKKRVRKKADSSSQPPSGSKDRASKIIEYLENEVLPVARNTRFSGMVPVDKNGVVEFRKIDSVAQLEELISELKRDTSKLMATTLPATNLPKQETKNEEQQPKKSLWKRLLGK